MAVSTRMLVLAALGSAGLMGLPQAAHAAFTCPAPLPSDAGPSVADIKKLLPSDIDPLDHVSALNSAVIALKAQNIPSSLVIDRLVAAYCPEVAANKSWSDAAKTARLRRFAARVVDVVYSLDSASAIIINVPLKPQVLEAAEAKAKAAKQPIDTWIAETVEKALAP
ncbi:hypothetical protein MKI84_12160 [Ancylobacter sp. A5.8]|uniref:hypothetical protein n=1 Tax=Ancylobacter gelatini TaxID=2919920 RepID=UPI001F4D38B8|nr:hypothetical protein [Ancylobacter gelatini]MCJ8143670.1 hypothetical protein [Ancylobacter gelatini]